MKIGIVTVHRGSSYGSNAQAYGLMTYLRQLEHEAEFIDLYTIGQHRALYPQLYPSTVKQIVNYIRSLRLLKIRLSKRKKFEEFQARYFPRSKRYYSMDEVFNSPPQYDVYISGSDQVLRANKKDELFRFNYLEFANKSKAKLVVYAGSFGKEVIPDNRQEIIKNLLQRIDRISCREQEACALVNKISGLPAEFVVDPTNLLSSEEWRSISKKVPHLPEKYIFVYLLLRNDGVLKIAEKIRNLTGYKIVLLDMVTPSKHRSEVDCVLYDIGMEEFIYLVDQSSFIVTNSFHGTTFATLFKKDFYSYAIPEDGFITRSMNMLSSIGLESRIVDENTKIDSSDLQVDYSNAWIKLIERIEYSKRFIEEALRERVIE